MGVNFFSNLSKWLSDTDKKLGYILYNITEFTNNTNISFNIIERYVPNTDKLIIKGIKTDKKYDGFIYICIYIDETEYFKVLDYKRNEYIDSDLMIKLSNVKGKYISVIIKDDNDRRIYPDKGIVYIK